MKHWMLATGALLVVALVICASVWNSTGPQVSPPLPHQDDFKVTVSGVLADRLEPETLLIFWNPDPKIKGDAFALGDLPLTLPFEHYRDNAWHVTFQSRTVRPSWFSVELAADLFEKPRTIDIKLDRPHPRIEPTFTYFGDLRYVASITERIRYSDLPYWDAKRGRLIASRPPVVQIKYWSDGKAIQESEMKLACWATKWWAFVDDFADLAEGTELLAVVRYDSGGLFDPIETRCRFTYQKSKRAIRRAEPRNAGERG